MQRFLASAMLPENSCPTSPSLAVSSTPSSFGAVLYYDSGFWSWTVEHFQINKKKFVLTRFNLGYLHINQEDKSEQHIESIRELDFIAL